MAAISVDEKAKWINEKLLISEEILRTYRFFVLNSSVDGLSSNEQLLFSSHTYEAMEDSLIKADLIDFPPGDIITERVCFYNNKSAQYLSLFFHIRNSFAHGRYNTVKYDKDVIFIMEDVTIKRKWMPSTKKTCSARMVLRLSTLSKWMDLIERDEIT